MTHDPGQFNNYRIQAEPKLDRHYFYSDGSHQWKLKIEFANGKEPQNLRPGSYEGGYTISTSTNCPIITITTNQSKDQADCALAMANGIKHLSQFITEAEKIRLKEPFKKLTHLQLSQYVSEQLGIPVQKTDPNKDQDSNNESASLMTS